MGCDTTEWCRTHRRRLVGQQLRDVVPIVNGAGFEVDVNESLLLPDPLDSTSAPRVLLLVNASHIVTGVRPAG